MKARGNPAGEKLGSPKRKTFTVDQYHPLLEVQTGAAETIFIGFLLGLGVDGDACPRAVLTSKRFVPMSFHV